MERWIFVTVALGLLLSPVIASRRNDLAEALWAGFDAAAKIPGVPGVFFLEADLALRPAVQRAMAGQAYAGPDGEQPLPSWGMWEPLASIINVACFTALVMFDISLVSVTFAAVYHEGGGGSLAQLSWLNALVFIAAATYLGIQLADWYQLTPARRPWCFLSEQHVKRLRRVAWACLVALLIAGVTLALWRQLQLNASHATIHRALTSSSPQQIQLVSPSEPISSILLWTALILLWSVLPLVSAGAGISLLPLLGAIITLFELIALGLLFSLSTFLIGVVLLLDGLHWFIVKLVDATAAGWGRTQWVWICSFAFAQGLHLTPIGDFAPRKRVGTEFTQRLFPGIPSDHLPDQFDHKEVAPMARTPRTANILGVGTRAAAFIDTQRQALDRQHATQFVLTMGRVTSSAYHGLHRTVLGRDGIRDVTPASEQAKNLVDRDADSQHHAQLHKLMDNVNDAEIAADVTDGLTLITQDVSEDVAATLEATAELKQRRDTETILELATIPNPDQYGPKLRAGYDALIAAQQGGLLDTALWVDRRSDLAKAISPEVQDEYVATALASALRGRLDSEHNHTLTDIARAAEVYGLSLASRCTSPGKQVAIYSVIRRLFGLPQKGTGNLDDMIKQATDGATAALTDATCRTIAEPIDLTRPCAIVFTVPLRSSDPRWMEFTRAMSTWLARHYPTASAIWASGSGAPDPRVPGLYWVQISVFFPIPLLPSPLAAIFAQHGLGDTELPDESPDGRAVDAGADVVAAGPLR